MIYRQIGLRNSNLTVVDTKLEPFQAVAMSIAPSLEETTDLKKYKQNQALYFVSGEFKTNEDGTITRNDSNLLYRDLICIDIEDIGINSTQAIELIKDKLQDFKYILYSTIRHEPNSPRLRLILEPDRNILKDEYKPTIKNVMQLLQLNYDSSSGTWSQLQGLPIEKRGNEFIFIKQLDGLQYPVQEAVREDKKVVIKYNDNPAIVQKINHDTALEIMSKYVENEQDKLQERNDNYLSCLMVLARSVITQELEYETALQCSEILALGNPEWIENNVNHLNSEIQRSNGNVDYFKTKYTFIGKFKKSQNKIKTVNQLNNETLEITTDDKGKVIQSLQNIEKIILSIVPIAYNELTEVIELKDNNGKIKVLEKRDKELIRMEIEKRYNFKCKMVDLETALVSASNKLKYHPIKEKIKSVEWDNTPRAETFFIDVLGVEDNPYTRECSRKWLLACIYRLFKPGIKFDEMIILHGGQGLGKSTTLQRLSLGYYTEITEKISEEVTFKMLRTWLVEFSELSTITKTDNETIKAWLSATKDTVRKKYSADVDDFPRSFIVLGTTNNKEILKDRTGNRRYWLMYGDKERIKTPIWNVSNDYLLQLWSEVYTWYKGNENLLISDKTKGYMEGLTHGALEFDPLEERIDKLFEMYLPLNWFEYISNPQTRYDLKRYITEYIDYGLITDSKYKLENVILNITTQELAFIMSDDDINQEIKGSGISKQVHKVMNNKENWKAGEVKRNGKRQRGFKRVR